MDPPPASGCANGSPSPWQLRSVVPVEERESILPLPSLPLSPLPTPSSQPPSSCIPAGGALRSSIQPLSVPGTSGTSVHCASSCSRHGLLAELRARGGALRPSAWGARRTSVYMGGGPAPAACGSRLSHVVPLLPLPYIFFLKGNSFLKLSQPEVGFIRQEGSVLVTWAACFL